MDGRQALIAYIVLAIVVLLIVWFADQKSLGAVFFWLLFVFIVMLVALSRCNGACLWYLFAVAFIPLIFWIFWAFGNCDKHKKDDHGHHNGPK